MKKRFFQDIIDIIRGKKKFLPKPQLGFIVFWVGTKCTLKCKLCCNLIPYLNQVSYDADEILEDLKFILKNADIPSFQIQGGEPFSHPDIIKILDFVSNLNLKYVDLATNGTVTLNKDIIDALKRNKNIYVRISDYDCTKTLREKFIKTLDENNIEYRIYDFYNHDKTWFSSGGINEQMADNRETKEIYEKCPNKNCNTLADGILTVCGKAKAIKEIYKYNQSKKYDEVNVRKIRKSINPFKDFILRYQLTKFMENLAVYKEQCRYCRISDKRYPAAEQMKNEEFNQAKILISNRKKI